MRRTDTELLTAVLQLQTSCNGHLIALDTPHLEDAGLIVDEIELIALIEYGTTVGSVILFDIQTRRIGLGKEYASIILTAQHSL